MFTKSHTHIAEISEVMKKLTVAAAEQNHHAVSEVRSKNSSKALCSLVATHQVQVLLSRQVCGAKKRQNEL